MLYSDGLIDFRSIVRMEPPNGSSETPYKRQAHGEEDRAAENENVRKTVGRLTSAQLIVELDSEEIVWLEVGRQSRSRWLADVLAWKASDEQVATEWFIQIRELCKYWAHRQRVE
jgi:hypothetical protein